MTWATIEDVSNVTGKTVTEQTRTLAVSAIELNTGLIEAVSRPDMNRSDAYWLRQAVVFQAAWLLAQPDYLERSAVSSVSQDGQSASAGNPDWLVLAPLTRKALRRLSWRGIRSVQTSQAAPRVRNINSDEYEAALPWRPVA